MEHIILSIRQPKVEYFRYYDDGYYSIFNGDLCKHRGGYVQVLAPHDKKKRCLGTAFDGKCLFYLFEDAVLRIHGRSDSIDVINVDMEGTDCCCISQGALFYKQGNKIKVDYLENGRLDELSCQIKNQATKIEVIPNKAILVSDTKGFIHIITKENINTYKIHADSIQDFIYNEDILITASRDKKVKRHKIDITSGKLRTVNASSSLPHFVNCLVCCGNIYVAGLSNGQLCVLTKDLEKICLKNINRDSIRTIQKVGNDFLITNADDGFCYLVSLESLTKRIRKRLIFGNIKDKIQCSVRKDNKLYLGFLSGKVECLDLQTLLRSEICILKNVRSLCIINDDHILAGLENGSIYDINNGRCLASGNATPYSMAFLPKKGELFVGRRDGSLDLYETKDGISLSLKKHVHAHDSIIGDILILDNCISTCSDDQSFCIWDRELNRVSRGMVSKRNTALNNILDVNGSLYFSSDNGFLYCVSDNNQTKIRLSRYPIRSLYYDGDGKIYAGDRQGNVYEYMISTRILNIYKGYSRVINIYPSETKSRIMIVFEEAVVTIDVEDKTMSRNKVFIIHGHNNELKREVQLLLEKQGIEGIILNEKADKGRTIIDKLIEEAATATYAIATLTPDDVVIDSTGIGNIMRARQNVLLEVGYFLGKLGKDRVLLLRLSDVEIPSDLNGVAYKTVVNVERGTWKTEVVKELAEAGFAIDFERFIRG